MGWAEGIVTDAPTGNGIPYAWAQDYIDGLWNSDAYGHWATPNAFPGMTITGSAPDHNAKSVQVSESSTVYDGSLGQYVWWVLIPLDRTPSTDGGGGGGGCFIATAAYGSELAPEVQFLQGIRDKVLRQTRWGREFFDQLWQRYYRISPPIAEAMYRDPNLRKVVGWSIVQPWVNYIKLVMSRPDLKRMDLDRLEPKLGEFLRQLHDDIETWLKGIELPRTFAGRDPMEAVQELNVILGFVLLGSASAEYLDDLKRKGELPLPHPQPQRAKLMRTLRESGRTDEEIACILG
jgi:hypothetical protein